MFTGSAQIVHSHYSNARLKFVEFDAFRLGFLLLLWFYHHSASEWLNIRPPVFARWAR